MVFFARAGRVAAPSAHLFLWRDTWLTIRRSGPASRVARAAEIDQSLKAHHEQGLRDHVSGGMLNTAAAAWATRPLAVSQDPTGATPCNARRSVPDRLSVEVIYTTPLRWVIIFAPLALHPVRLGRADAPRCRRRPCPSAFFAFAAVMGVSMRLDLPSFFTSYSIVQTFLCDADRLRGPQPLGFYHREKGPVRHGHVPDHGRDRPDRGDW